MAIDRGRLEELRAKRETGELTDREAQELDRLQAETEKREPLRSEEPRDPRARPMPPG